MMHLCIMFCTCWTPHPGCSDLIIPFITIFFTNVMLWRISCSECSLTHSHTFTSLLFIRHPCLFAREISRLKDAKLYFPGCIIICAYYSDFDVQDDKCEKRAPWPKSFSVVTSETCKSNNQLIGPTVLNRRSTESRAISRSYTLPAFPCWAHAGPVYGPYGLHSL